MAMDPVNKKAVKKDFKNRNDKDIDNDGDVDSSDEYLHKRRKAVSKAIKNVKESLELAESDFSVGQKVEYEAPDGGEYYGTVIKLDKPEEGAYYHVKLENGKVVKASPDQLEAEDDDGNKASVNQNEPDKWLNETLKGSDEPTKEWLNVCEGISKGKIKSVNQVRKHYKVSKQIEEKLNQKLNK